MCLNGKYVDVYFQGRSNIYGWSVRDLDFNRMTNPYGSTQLDPTQCSQVVNISESFLSLTSMYIWL
jgi:hypothetical protein